MKRIAIIFSLLLVSLGCISDSDDNENDTNDHGTEFHDASYFIEVTTNSTSNNTIIVPYLHHIYIDYSDQMETIKANLSISSNVSSLKMVNCEYWVSALYNAWGIEIVFKGSFKMQYHIALGGYLSLQTRIPYNNTNWVHLDTQENDSFYLSLEANTPDDWHFRETKPYRQKISQGWNMIFLAETSAEA